MNFPAQLSSLSTLAAWLAQQMAPLSVGEEWRFALDLAVCETATNIIRYALHEDRQRVFRVEFIATEDRVTLRFIDAGEVFPAERLALARGDERFDVDPLAESGRGLRLILRAVDYFNVETRAGGECDDPDKSVAGCRSSPFHRRSRQVKEQSLPPGESPGEFSRPRSPSSSVLWLGLSGGQRAQVIRAKSI
ncbi:ATP-binding protein [Klebsiella pneumoniae subsp. pneumoniae]|nr:ATP-binding protein [Klebsiella pneumoniae subsp. pneumoniae]